MSRGFSLVEALVALVVLSLGMLGAAGLVLGGMRDQSLALRHGAATALVTNMANRIRANPGAREAYDSRAADLPAECAGSPCDARRLAAHDRAYFESAAAILLPHARPHAQIVFEPALGSAAADRYHLSLTWRDARDPDANHEATLILLAQPVAGTP
jgi:type IV pilus modification protein PilV